MKRINPAKCNDGSFSASPFNSKGTCTWHQGVQGSATQDEYDKSQSRVRYRSPKDYTSSFAPPKGKTSKGSKSSEPIAKSISVANENYDFKAFKGIPLINQTVLDQCIQYFSKKDIQSIVLPNYIQSAERLSVEELYDIRSDGQSVGLIYEGANNYQISLQVENEKSPVWVISFGLSDEKVSYGSFSFTTSPKDFKKTLVFVIDLLNVFDILCTMESSIKKDHILYQFVKTLLNQAYDNKLAFINVLTSTMVDCENALVKSKDKEIKYKLGYLTFLKDNVHLKNQTTASTTDFIFPIPSEMYATYVAYMFNLHEVFADSTSGSMIGSMAFENILPVIIKDVQLSIYVNDKKTLTTVNKINEMILKNLSSVKVTVSNKAKPEKAYYTFSLARTEIFEITPAFDRLNKQLDVVDQPNMSLLKLVQLVLYNNILIDGYFILAKGAGASVGSSDNNFELAVDIMDQLQALLDKYPSNKPYFKEYPTPTGFEFKPSDFIQQFVNITKVKKVIKKTSKNKK